MLALLAEDKVTLFGFRDDEVELHLFSQHGGREREGVEGGVGHLRLQRTKLGRVSSQLASFQAAHLKMVIDKRPAILDFYLLPDLAVQAESEKANTSSFRG